MLIVLLLRWLKRKEILSILTYEGVPLEGFASLQPLDVTDPMLQSARVIVAQPWLPFPESHPPGLLSHQ